MLAGNLLSFNVYIRKEEKSQINDLSFHLKLSEKEQIKPTSKRKQIIKSRKYGTKNIKAREKNQ